MKTLSALSHKRDISLKEKESLRVYPNHHETVFHFTILLLQETKKKSKLTKPINAQVHEVNLIEVTELNAAKEEVESK